LGEKNKSFKRRFFVVWNSKNNFKIEYFESENGTVKGQINAAGYYTESFSSEEVASLNCSHGVKLVPYSSLRRTWYFKFDTGAEKDEWLQIFDVACNRVKLIITVM
jgi:hypothetical protein